MLPDGLNSRASDGGLPTPLGCWLSTRQPIPPRTSGDGPHAVAPSSRTITRQRTRCQSNRKGTPTLKERGARLTCHIVSYEVDTTLLQYAPNLLNIIHIHASNTNAALNLAVAVLNDFELKRDTVQTENDLPAQ